MAKTSTWVITTDGSVPLDAVVQAAVAAGAQVQQRLAELGLLVATGSAAQAAAWRRLAGVAAVEADRGVDVGPPDAGVS